MWKLKVAEGGKDGSGYLDSTNNFAGRQTWEFDPDAGTAEERAEVEAARLHFYNNRHLVKPSNDLLWRMQFLREKKFKQKIPAVKVEDGEVITHEKTRDALRRSEPQQFDHRLLRILTSEPRNIKAIGAIWWMLLTLTISTCLVPAYTMGNWEHPEEMEALSTFVMYSNYFNHDVLTNWDFTLRNPCTWYYITCNSENKTIAVIIPNKNLSGPLLVPELGELSALESLAFHQNRLTGTIPQELGNLKKLVYLNLSGNQLSGSIPISISTISALRSADFSNNNNLCWDFWPTPVFKGIYPLCQKE